MGATSFENVTCPCAAAFAGTCAPAVAGVAICTTIAINPASTTPAGPKCRGFHMALIWPPPEICNGISTLDTRRTDSPCQGAQNPDTCGQCRVFAEILCLAPQRCHSSET